MVENRNSRCQMPFSLLKWKYWGALLFSKTDRHLLFTKVFYVLFVIPHRNFYRSVVRKGIAVMLSPILSLLEGVWCLTVEALLRRKSFPLTLYRNQTLNLYSLKKYGVIFRAIGLCCLNTVCHFEIIILCVLCWFKKANISTKITFLLQFLLIYTSFHFV